MIRACLTAVIICQLFSCAHSQSRTPEQGSEKRTELAERIRKFYRLYPREKAFLFTDNTVYVPGETVWYKLYLWNDDAAEAKVSNVAHVVIRNNAGAVVIRQHVLVAGNESHGDIALPDSLAAGIYSVEVFTNWMLNFSSSPITARALWISDGKQSITAYSTESFQPVIKPEGGRLSGNGSVNKIAVWSGAAGFNFQLIDPNGRSVFHEQFTGPYAIVNVRLSVPGVYQAKVCPVNASRCYEESLTTSADIAIRLYENVPLNKIQVAFNNRIPPDEQWLLALTESSLVDMIRLPAGHDSLDLHTENYPEGIIHLVVVDGRHQLQSHRAFYHVKEKGGGRVIQSEHIQKTLHGHRLQIQLERPVTEDFAATIAPEGMRCSPFFLKYVVMDGHTRNDIMLFQPFGLEGSLTKFLNASYLPIVHSTHTPLNKRLDYIPVKGNSPGPLTMILSGLNRAGRADSIVAFKKELAKIDATYYNNSNTALVYEKIPADAAYVPRDYPSMKGLVELLRQAIPQLKFSSQHDHNAMSFLVSNLKGQKSLYPGKPTVTLNGYVVHDLNTIKDLPFSEITSIEILYQPQTLVGTNLKNIFPYGVIAIYTSEAASVLTKTMTIGKRFFSGALSWPHVFQARSIFPEGAGDRWPFFRSLYAWRPDLDFIRQKQLPIGEIPVQRPPRCIFLGFSLAQVKQEAVMEILID